MTTLLRMCCESGCEQILVEGRWVGKDYSDYNKLINSRNITYGYCPEHLNNNSSQRQLIEIRKMRAAGLM